MTRLLTASQLGQSIDVDAALAAMTAGFRADHAVTDRRHVVTGQRVHTSLPAPGTATVLLPGLLPGMPAYTVKVNAKFPTATPAVRGVVCLHSLSDGALLALLDSAALTAWRTGLAAAAGADALAPPGPARVAFVGCGAQARLVLTGLRALRQVTAVGGYDRQGDRARRFLADCGGSDPVELLSDAAAAAAWADIVVFATWSRSPLLTAADLRPGLQITSVGADEPGKLELAADVLTTSFLVVDDPTLVTETGAVGSAGLGADVIDATMGELLARPRPLPADRPIAYTPVGLPWQDLALAWPVWQAAMARDIGVDVDLLS
jgi:alanine dehydrogenase